ncbi:MAG: ATP-binding protein [Candidatus Eisenbacteria bacterium]
MAETNDLDKVDLTFPSLLDYIGLVNAVTEEIGDHLGLDEEERDAVSNSVVEACTNAIEHGNKLDRSKNVLVRFRTAPGRIEIGVSDQGEGFDPQGIQDPRTPENLMRERGRGIFILRAFMDEVRYEFGPDWGTTVWMVKRLSGKPGRNGN